MLRACVLIGVALSVGGITFHYFVEETNSRRTLALIATGAIAVAICQLLDLVLLALSFTGESGALPVPALASTAFAQAGITRAALAACLGISALVLKNSPVSRTAWRFLTVLAMLFLASGAVLTHGASRLEHAFALASVTILHQLAAAAWIGGLIHLLAQWRSLRGAEDVECQWPRLVNRFSPLASGAVAMLLCGGVYLFWRYVNDLGGLVGTAYGIMLFAKITLLCAALLLGGANFLNVRRWTTRGDAGELIRKTPLFVELELGIGAIIIMASATLTDQSPAVDVTAERATPSEVAQVFLPKRPRLTPISIPKMNAERNGTADDSYAEPTALEKAQSNFTHNVSGLFVIMIGLLALVQHLTGASGFRHWPFLLIPFSFFLTIFAQPTGWPLGPKGFRESMLSVEALQHRLATLVAAGIGYFEWRVQTKAAVNAALSYVLPILCCVGGALLLTHVHSIVPQKNAFLIEASHNAIGVLAVFTGAGRWLELKSQDRVGRIAGHVWPICFIAIGVVLLFYRE